MSEVFSCGPCGAEFHQSYLAGHVESFHVPQRSENMILLSCLSCPYSVPLLHKNAMLHHCYATGHDISNVETQFHNFLQLERARIEQALQEGFRLLKSNLDPPPPIPKSGSPIPPTKIPASELNKNPSHSKVPRLSSTPQRLKKDEFESESEKHHVESKKKT